MKIVSFEFSNCVKKIPPIFFNISALLILMFIHCSQVFAAASAGPFITHYAYYDAKDPENDVWLAMAAEYAALIKKKEQAPKPDSVDE